MQEHEVLRNERYLHERIFIGRDRLHLLDTFNWYPNMVGGWAHPHAMDFKAAIPEWLAPDNRRK